LCKKVKSYIFCPLRYKIKPGTKHNFYAKLSNFYRM